MQHYQPIFPFFGVLPNIQEMKTRHLLLLALFTIVYTSLPAQSQQSHLNLESGLAIEGYDPVAYFVSGKALEGKKEFSTQVDGGTYRFVSAANRELFQKNPTQYQPQYGGWCAYAMGATGEKVEVDPETFKIVDNKLYLFYNAYFNNTLKKWNTDESKLKKQADENWKKITK
jgi:YHS domain-containing protein